MDNTYKSLFSEAIERTVKFRMDLPNEDLGAIGKVNTLFGTPENIQEAFTHVYKSLGGFDSEEISGGCVKYSMLSKKHFEDYLNTKTVLTVGYIVDKGQEFFKFGEKEIQSLIDSQPEKYRRANFHVWLTLPGFEIIDLTYLETKRNVMGVPFNQETGFKYVFRNVEELYYKQSLVYCPLLVGEDSLFKMGIVSKVISN